MPFLISFLGWSQPAPQQSQPPIVVQVEMPPTNSWVHLSELVIPAIIAAVVAFFGVWLTNRTNERTNEQTRRHQRDLERIKDEIAAEASSRDNRWAFRKDVYSDVIKTISTLLVLFNQSLALNRSYLAAVNNPPEMQAVAALLQEFRPQFNAATVDFFHFANLSRLATADWLVQRIAQLTPVLNPPFAFSVLSPDYPQSIVPAMNALNELLKLVSETGRKDLWGAAEPETKAGAAT